MTLCHYRRTDTVPEAVLCIGQGLCRVGGWGGGGVAVSSRHNSGAGCFGRDSLLQVELFRFPVLVIGTANLGVAWQQTLFLLQVALLTVNGIPVHFRPFRKLCRRMAPQPSALPRSLRRDWKHHLGRHRRLRNIQEKLLRQGVEGSG
jgi:hypothetical protein